MYDIVGDIHGCIDELKELIHLLGYRLVRRQKMDGHQMVWVHPQERVLVSAGDIFDRGPDDFACANLLISMEHDGCARTVMGNHDFKMMQAIKTFLSGDEPRSIPMKDRFERLAGQDRRWLQELHNWLRSLPAEINTPDINISHAGLPEQYQGITHCGRRAFSCALYGVNMGEDEHNLPIRLYWAPNYKGDRYVVHGHIRSRKEPHLPSICGKVYNIDTSCVYGGNLTALRFPSMEVMQVRAKRAYYEG